MTEKMLALLLILASATVIAGEKTGNGGGGHVCPGSVELYDFYEGSHPDLYNFKLLVLDPTLSTNEYINLGIEKLGAKAPGLVPGLQNIITGIQSIPYDRLVRPIKIPRIPDADIPFVNEDCEYEQIANWNDRFDTLFFRKKLFEALDPMNQAGLYVHEALYKAGRDLNNLEDSNFVRKLVAKLYSEEKIETTDVRNVFGNNVLLASKQGNCHLKFQFSAQAGSKCVPVDKSGEIIVNDKTIKLRNFETDVQCDVLHSSGQIELSYNAYEGSNCIFSVDINGESYTMKEKPYTYKNILEFQQF